MPRPNSKEDAQNQILMPVERRITESRNSLGYLPPDQVAQSPTQPDLVYFQGWGTYNLKPNFLHSPARGKPVSGFGMGLAGPGHPRSSSGEGRGCPGCASSLCIVLAAPWVPSHLRLLDRGRRQGECLPSSSVTLSVLRKCLERKCSSSGVGWYGSWCRRSWEDEDDWEEREGCRRSGDGSVLPGVGVGTSKPVRGVSLGVS